MRALMMTKKAGWWGWQPWANTLLYVPMKSDLTDHWPNQYTLTNNGVTLVQNQANIDVGYFDGSSDITCPSSPTFTDFHVWFWMKIQQVTNQIFVWQTNWDIFFATQSGMWIWIWRKWVAWDSRVNYTFDGNTWYYVSFDKQWNNFTISLNNSNILTTTNSRSYSLSWWFVIWSQWGNPYVLGYISDFIMESAAWSAQEKSDYYDLTKSNYWIS